MQAHRLLQKLYGTEQTMEEIVFHFGRKYSPPGFHFPSIHRPGNHYQGRLQLAEPGVGGATALELQPTKNQWKTMFMP
jgi:hypothetical protein